MDGQIDLDHFIDVAAETRRPAQINVRGKTGVLVSEELWSGIQETLLLLSCPQMHASIRKGMREPHRNLSTKLRW